MPGKKKGTAKRSSPRSKRRATATAGDSGKGKPLARATPSRRKKGSLGDFIKSLNGAKKKSSDTRKKSIETPVFLCTDAMPSDTTTLSTRSPLFNLFLSESIAGGIPLGRIIEVYGDHDQGKTSILTEMMIAFQKAGGVVLFHDSDFKFNRERAERRGWMPDRTIYLPELSIEGILSQSEKTITQLRKYSGLEDIPVMIAWDSAPSTPIRGNVPGVNSEGGGGMMEAARVMWDKLSRRMVGFLNMNNVTLVATSPQIANIQFGGSGPKKTTALGGALKTQATLRIRVWRSGLFKWTKDAPPGSAVGIYISMNATKHHYRMLGERQITLSYMFDSGFNPYYDVFNYLMLTGAFIGDEKALDGSNLLIRESGGRYTILGVDSKMYYREVGEFLADNPALYLTMVKAMESHYLTGLIAEWPLIGSSGEGNQ